MAMNVPVVVAGENYEQFNGCVNGFVETGLASLAAADISVSDTGQIAEADPVRIEVNPYYIDGPGFLVRSLHRLRDFTVSEGFQLHEFSFGLEEAGRRLVACTEGRLRHILPGETAVFL